MRGPLNAQLIRERVELVGLSRPIDNKHLKGGYSRFRISAIVCEGSCRYAIHS